MNSPFASNLFPTIGGARGGWYKKETGKSAKSCQKVLSLALSQGEGTTFAKIELNNFFGLITRKINL